MLAVTDVMLQDRTLSCSALAEAIYNRCNDLKIPGYPPNLRTALHQAGGAREFETLLLANNHSRDSGVAVRALPLGCFPTPETVIQAARVNAQLTNDTTAGHATSIITALMSYYYFHDVRECGLIDFITRYDRTLEDTSREQLKEMLGQGRGFPEYYRLRSFQRELDHINGDSPYDGILSVGAAFYLIQNISDASEILHQAFRLGGDTSAAASLALGIKGMQQNGLHGLDNRLYQGLCEGRKERDELVSQGRILQKVFGKTTFPLVATTKTSDPYHEFVRFWIQYEYFGSNDPEQWDLSPQSIHDRMQKFLNDNRLKPTQANTLLVNDNPHDAHLGPITYKKVNDVLHFHFMKYGFHVLASSDELEMLLLTQNRHVLRVKLRESTKIIRASQALVTNDMAIREYIDREVMEAQQYACEVTIEDLVHENEQNPRLSFDNIRDDEEVPGQFRFLFHQDDEEYREFFETMDIPCSKNIRLQFNLTAMQDPEIRKKIIEVLSYAVREYLPA